MKYKFYRPQAIYEIGQRDNQEDYILPEAGKESPSTRCFILCDGMGGHEKGEVASKTIASALYAFIGKHTDNNSVMTDDILQEGIQKAWQQLNEKYSGGEKKMGTTLCVLYFHRGGCTALHIGDSRIYHVRPSAQQIIFRSRDHSLVTDLFAAGELTYEQMLTSPQKNIITKALMAGQEEMPSPSIVHIADIRPGDYFYLCSDGMMEQMSDDDLLHILCAQGTDEKKRQQLLAASMENTDNHSAHLIHVEQVINEEGDEQLPNDEQTTHDNFMNLLPATGESQASDVIIEPATPAYPQPQAGRATGTSTHTSPAVKKQKSHIWLIVAVSVVVLIGLSAAMFFQTEEKEDTEVPQINPVQQVEEEKDDNVEIEAPAKRPYAEPARLAQPTPEKKTPQKTSTRKTTSTKTPKANTGEKVPNETTKPENAQPLESNKPKKKEDIKNQMLNKFNGGN